MNRQLTTEELRRGKVSRKEFMQIPRRKISMVLDGIKSGSNLGNIFRMADAMLIEKIWICGEEPILGNKFRRASRGIEKWVDWEYRQDTEKLVAELKQSGHSVIAMELCNTSISLSAFKFQKPLILVFGSESAGVSEEVLRLCDTSVHLPMLGMGNSVNLATSVAIALYEATRPLIAEK